MNNMPTQFSRSHSVPFTVSWSSMCGRAYRYIDPHPLVSRVLLLFPMKTLKGLGYQGYLGPISFWCRRFGSPRRGSWLNPRGSGRGSQHAVRLQGGVGELRRRGTQRPEEFETKGTVLWEDRRPHRGQGRSFVVQGHEGSNVASRLPRKEN